MRHVSPFAATLVTALLTAACPATAQDDYGHGSRNLGLVGQLVVDGGTGAIAVEQDPERPYVYLARDGPQAGTVAVDVSDPENPRAVPGHETTDAAVRDLTLFSLAERRFLALATERGAEIFDVTDPSRVSEVGRLSTEGGFRDLFAYKHSGGLSLLFATGGGNAFAYELRLATDIREVLAATIEAPETIEGVSGGFDDIFVGYEPESAQDRLYAAGGGGYWVFDVTDFASPELLVTVSSAAVQRGRVIAPTPDGRLALTAAGYRTAPVRIFDTSGAMSRVRTAVGAWTADWRADYVDIQVRWPFAFAAALENGLQVVNVFDPVAPYTDAYYMPHSDTPAGLNAEPTGIVRVDIRNHDGLVVASDLEQGFLAFRLDAFGGWHGHAWGLPNVSRAQDWENGPDGR